MEEAFLRFICQYAIDDRTTKFVKILHFSLCKKCITLGCGKGYICEFNKLKCGTEFALFAII